MIFLIVLLRSVTLLWLGSAQPKRSNRALFRRAGGARADDNFTKKPQKKLIRYMVVFWGFNTTS